MMGRIGRQSASASATAAIGTAPREGRPIPVRADASSALSSAQWVVALGEVTGAFSRWLDAHEEEERLWPAFGVFTREMLLDLVGAKRVMLFRVDETVQGLRPLGGPSDASSVAQPIAGLAQHVLATGRRYIRGDWSHGPLVDELAADVVPTDAASDAHGAAIGPAAWMFGIHSRGVASPSATRGPGQPVGLVVVGDLPDSGIEDRTGLDVLANLITEFWLHVRDFEHLRLARRTDRGSGVLNRADLLAAAEAVAAEAMRDGEPIVAMAVALEGLRKLDDDGHWETRDRLIREAGRVLRRKLRSDDLVGRFSDDRFVAVLRRLDVALGRLIATKVVESIAAATSSIIGEDFADADAAAGRAAPVKVRCGLAASRCAESDARRSRTSAPNAAASSVRPDSGRLDPCSRTLSGLLAGALSASATARRNGQDVCVAPNAASSEGEADA